MIFSAEQLPKVCRGHPTASFTLVVTVFLCVPDRNIVLYNTYTAKCKKAENLRNPPKSCVVTIHPPSCYRRTYARMIS
jgi:hypothetical protein